MQHHQACLLGFGLETVATGRKILIININDLDMCFAGTHLPFHLHIPVMRSLDHTGMPLCHPQCCGHPLFVRYWEAAVLGTNPNLLLRTESQHTSVDSNHSSVQCGHNQTCNCSLLLGIGINTLDIY